jgi:hypothetical protein
MKQETHDIAVQATKAAPAIGGTWYATATPNEVVALVVGVVTAIYVAIQIVYLLRKWVREETAFGIKMKSKNPDFGSSL